MPDQNWQFELEEYTKQGEPDRAEKSEAWQTAIGLQAVDGLKTSDYLLDTAKDTSRAKSPLMRRRSVSTAITSREPPVQKSKTKPKRQISYLQE